ARRPRAAGLGPKKPHTTRGVAISPGGAANRGKEVGAPPANATFIHRQTLAGQVRFTTTELAGLEARIASAADRALKLELEIFDPLAARVTAAAAAAKQAADSLATIAVAAALGPLPVSRRPRLP